MQRQIGFIIDDQKKLMELIPLSAAARGMMCGQAQLDNLRSAICDEISTGFRIIGGSHVGSDNQIANEITTNRL